MTLFPDQETQDAYETLFEEEILLAVPAFLEVAGILKPIESVYPRLPLSELEMCIRDRYNERHIRFHQIFTLLNRKERK